MEYSYIDIEAKIRHAQALRAQALSEFLAASYKKIVPWCAGLIRHKVQQAGVAARSSPAAIC